MNCCCFFSVNRFSFFPENTTYFFLEKKKQQKKDTRCFHTKRIKAFQRIGPHNLDVLSTLVGNLLGDSWGEKRGNASRFHLHMSSRNVEYLHWLHTFFATQGYCSPEKPKMLRQIGKGGKIYFSYKMRTWSFSSLNWLYDLFYYYCPIKNKWIKTIPTNIETLLTPRSLAIWVMDDGGAASAGLGLNTQGFSKQNVEHLQHALKSKFGILTTLHKSGSNFKIYVPKNQCSGFLNIIDPFLLDCMRYKLRNAGNFVKKKIVN